MTNIDKAEVILGVLYHHSGKITLALIEELRLSKELFIFKEAQRHLFNLKVRSTYYTTTNEKKF